MILAGLGFDPANLHAESFGGVRTRAAAKRPPVGQGGDAAESPEEGEFAVEFATTGIVARVDGATPLLDVAEAHDVSLEYSCRSGACGACKCRLLAGEVVRGSEDGLSAAEVAEGYVLTCTAVARSDLVLDA